MNKNKLATFLTLVLGAVASPTVYSLSPGNNALEMDWNGILTVLDPNGNAVPSIIYPKNANGYQTAVSGTMRFDILNGAGSATMAPFDFNGAPSEVTSIRMQAIGDGYGGLGSLILTNMLVNWNGVVGSPVSVVMDGAGMFGQMDVGTFGTTVGQVSNQASVLGFGAIPASDDTYLFDSNSYLNIGPVPISTTEWNLTAAPDCGNAQNQTDFSTGGGCMNNGLSGLSPLIRDTRLNTNEFGYPNGDGSGIGGVPVWDGPTVGFNINLDIISMTITKPGVSSVPSLSTVYTSPVSGYQQDIFTFFTTLSKPLTTGYSVGILIDGALQEAAMDCGTGTSCTYSHVIQSAGVDRLYTVYLRKNGAAIQTLTGTYTVQVLPNIIPTVSIISAAAVATATEPYSTQLQFSDGNSNLMNAQINWGDGNVSAMVELSGGSGLATFSHTYAVAGTYIWNATVYDHNDATAQVSKTVVVTNDVSTAAPLVSSLNASANSSGQITGGLTVSHPENQVKNLRVYFANTATFAGALSIDIGNYTNLQATGAKIFTFDASQWLGQTVYYKVEVFSASGVQTLPPPEGNVVLSSISLPSITKPTMVDGTGLNAYIFRVNLSESVPVGYGVFLNFDDRRGNWFVENTPGGHFKLNDLGNGYYEIPYTMVKPGLRSVRAGIFNTQGDPDVLIGGYSNGVTCTLDSCIEAALSDHSYIVGNPVISGTGSKLFKNVNVANGNYHLSMTDISVPGKGPSFNFSRAYNSLAEPGSQWTFSYEMKAQYVDGYRRVIAIGPHEDGHMQYYFKKMDGDDNPVNDLWYTLTPGNFDQLIESPDPSGSSFTLYTQGNRLYNYEVPDGSYAGRLKNIQDRLGNALTFGYTNNLLDTVTDANNRSYTITRDVNNRIKRVTEFATIDYPIRFVEYTYDANGMITRVQNVTGGLDEYTYAGTTGDDRFRLATITDPRQNRQLTITYLSTLPIDNPDYGKVYTLLDAANQQIVFSYGFDSVSGKPYTGIVQPKVDELNHNRVYILNDNKTMVEEILDAQNLADFRTKITHQTINDMTRLAELALVTRTVEPNNNALDIGTSIEYVSGGRPVKVIDARQKENLATIATYAADNPVQPNLKPVATIKVPGVASATRYERFTTTGKAQDIYDPLNNKTTRVFNPDEWVTQSVDARFNPTNFLYDVYGNVAQVTDAKGNITQKTYDKLGRLKIEVTPLGLTTIYTYDNSGNIKTQNQKGADIDYTTYYNYDVSGNLVKTTDPLGHITNYIYDAANRKIEENYQVGTVIHTRKYSYDALGRLATVTNELDETSTIHYTSRSKVKYKKNARQDITVTYSYDKTGNIATVTDGDDHTTTYEYDVLNRKTKVTNDLYLDDLNNYQQWFYNDAGLVEKYRDSRGLFTFYLYDANGNITQVTDAEGGISKSEYDANGNVIKVTDANNHITTYIYDELDRRITTVLNDGVSQWHYEYDANGNQTKEITPTGEVTLQSYDALNRVSQLTEYDANNNITRQISYDYDPNNNVTSVSSAGNSISYSYDEINRVISATDFFGKTIAYGYDKAGNRTSLTYPGNKTIQYVYDVADRLKSLTDWLNKTSTYTRNKMGQPTQIILGNGSKVTYLYDSAGRLTELKNLKANGVVISSHQLTLDAEGNIKESVMDLPLLPQLPLDTGSMSYDNNNRLLQAGSDSYTHDNSGRIIQESKNGVQTIYNFDINDHITSITKDSTTLSSYAYDQNNNRISQTQNGIETRYVIDELAALPNVIAETDNLGVVSNYYIYGDGLVSQISAANDAHYYHYDQTGHTLALSDASGNVTDSYAYTPYGYTTTQGATHNPFKFVGKHGVMDDGDGLHYMRARYYKEGIKRFVSLDALHGDMMSPQALNRYAYVLGNPIMGIDPSGYEFSLLEYVYYKKSLMFGWLSRKKEEFNVMVEKETGFTAAVESRRSLQKYSELKGNTIVPDNEPLDRDSNKEVIPKIKLAINILSLFSPDKTMLITKKALELKAEGKTRGEAAAILTSEHIERAIVRTGKTTSEIIKEILTLRVMKKQLDKYLTEIYRY